MNDTTKHIMKRYTCRDFYDNPLADDLIETLVEAALAAPSAQNLQPWHVSVVTDKKLIEKIDAATLEELANLEDKMYFDRITERGGKVLYDAPCLIAVSAPPEAVWAPIDCGILCQNVVIAAESMGLGSCIVGLLRMPFDGKHGEEFKKLLQFPDGYEFVISILVGKVKTGKPPHDLDRSKVSYIK